MKEFASSLRRYFPVICINPYNLHFGLNSLLQIQHKDIEKEIERAGHAASAPSDVTLAANGGPVRVGGGRPANERRGAESLHWRIELSG
jgi:hypothetical protein